jgi:hypothetical protein
LYSSITLGADGLPVVSYHSGGTASPGPGSLWVAKCGNPACTGSSTITLVASGYAPHGNGLYTSIALGADGLPVIGYREADGNRLTMVKCGNAACSASNTGGPVDTTGNVGDYSSIALGADGLPVISYRDIANGDLKVAKCGNPACTSANTLTTVDSAGDVGYLGSIALGSDGLPVISYYDNTNHALKVAKCANAACTGTSTLTTVDRSADVGWFASITLGADGLPVISYYDVANGDLKVVKCSSATCVPFVRRR